MKSLDSKAKELLARSLKDACTDFDIEVIPLAKNSHISYQNWYKRLSGITEIKLMDILVICEFYRIDPIKFFTYIIKIYCKLTRIEYHRVKNESNYKATD